MWTREFGLAMLHARRLCIELIFTFGHGKSSQQLPTVGVLKVQRRSQSPERGVVASNGVKRDIYLLSAPYRMMQSGELLATATTAVDVHGGRLAFAG